ncbi:MAG: sulfatase family protein [Planctomycetota bacterium]|jgi:choline-sulfatase
MRNILLITADQLRYDCLGYRGVFPVKTPNLDKLAADGTIFENTYCSNPLCVPARASIMNGKNCYDHGVYYNDQGWSDELDTIPGVLSKNGYHTVSVGKMHFMPARKHYGFDKRIADNSTDHKNYLERKGLSENKPPIKSKQDAYDWTFRDVPTDLPDEDYLPFYVTESAVNELDLINHRRNCHPGGNEPFFMWLSYLLPHVPCTPPEPYFSMYKPEDMPPLIKSEEELNTFSRQVTGWKDEWSFITDEHAQKLRAQYLGCITLVDDMIGKVIDKLKELGLYDNTLIVFTSDHGDYMGDHYMQQKAFFHDCSSRIPFFFTGPDVGKGKVVHELVSQIDLLPTILDYCGLILEQKGIEVDITTSDAISIKGALEGGELSKDRTMISESGILGYSVMMRQGTTKINFYEDTGEVDIFDLENDPHELNNLGKDKTVNDIPGHFQKVLKDILRKIDKHRDMTYYHNGKRREMFS